MCFVLTTCGRRCLPFLPLLSALCVLLAFGVGTSCAAPAASDPVFDIPRMEGLKIDGDPADWGDRGFRVEGLAEDQGARPPAKSFDARFRLGWNDEGLLLLVEVRDETVCEAADDQLYLADSIEVFVADHDTAPENCYQTIVSPGRDPAHPKLRRLFMDRRWGDPVKGLSAQAERTVRADGYVLELLLPWKNLHVTPKLGDTIGFGLWVNDADGRGSRYQVAWPPRLLSGRPGQASHALRLAQTASSPVMAAPAVEYRTARQLWITVSAPLEEAGKPVEVRNGDTVVGRAPLAAGEGKAEAQVILPAPAAGRPFPELGVYLAGHLQGSVGVKGLARARAVQELDLVYNFHPCVFDGTSFPTGAFDQPALAEDLLGRYTVKTTFYDSSYRVVKKALKPGRYGAVVEITPEGEAPFLVFRTLFRAPYSEGTPPEWTRDWLLAHGQALGFDPVVLTEQAGVIHDVFVRRKHSGEDDALVAALVAALYEAKPTGAIAHSQDDALAQDRQWWVGLKRTLYGDDVRYPNPIVCPRNLRRPARPGVARGEPGGSRDEAGGGGEVGRPA